MSMKTMMPSLIYESVEFCAGQKINQNKIREAMKKSRKLIQTYQTSTRKFDLPLELK